MSWNLIDLTHTTRRYATAEARADILAGRLYHSKRAKAGTAMLYQSMLMRALEAGTPESFAREIHSSDMLQPNKHGTAHASAHETLAGGEFIRYYVRGLCLHATDIRAPELEIYRAKLVGSPRPASLALVGTRIPTLKLLADLRAHIGLDPALGVPNGPNSGLCARLPHSRPAQPA